MNVLAWGVHGNVSVVYSVRVPVSDMALVLMSAIGMKGGDGVRTCTCRAGSRHQSVLVETQPDLHDTSLGAGAPFSVLISNHME